MTDMTIGNVADVVGVGVETIRFYERRKLIKQPPRPKEGGYRIYSDTTVSRLHFIRRAQELGFSLREIAELLSLRDAEDDRADASDVRQRAIAKLHNVDQKIDQLRQIREELAALVDRCPGQGPLQCCTIFEALEQKTGVKGCSVSCESGEARVAVDEAKTPDE